MNCVVICQECEYHHDEDDVSSYDPLVEEATRHSHETGHERFTVFDDKSGSVEIRELEISEKSTGERVKIVAGDLKRRLFENLS